MGGRRPHNVDAVREARRALLSDPVIAPLAMAATAVIVHEGGAGCHRAYIEMRDDNGDIGIVDSVRVTDAVTSMSAAVLLRAAREAHAFPGEGEFFCVRVEFDPMLIAMSGLPGSGKTTEARAIQAQSARTWAVLSRDDARRALGLAMTPGEQLLSTEGEAMLTAALDIMVGSFLSAGACVIVDAMHLKPENLQHWQGIARQAGAEFRPRVLATPIEICIARDAARGAAGGRMVGERMIRKIAERGGPVPPEEDEDG